MLINEINHCGYCNEVYLLCAQLNIQGESSKYIDLFDITRFIEYKYLSDLIT